jgi:hypothetical protein
MRTITHIACLLIGICLGSVSDAAVYRARAPMAVKP